MDSLVETLSTQHRLVERLVVEITAAQQAQDVPALRAALGAMGSALLAHLALEDVHLYPRLVSLAEESGQLTLKQVTRDFSTSMFTISQSLQRFLARYQKPASSLEGFSRDWAGVGATLAARTSAEDTFLFPLYTRLSLSPPPRPLRAP